MIPLDLKMHTGPPSARGLIPLKPGIHRFLGSAGLLPLSLFMSDRKRGYSGDFGFINFNKLFSFSVKCLETWHIQVFRVCEYIGIVRFHVRSKPRIYSDHHYFTIDPPLLPY